MHGVLFLRQTGVTMLAFRKWIQLLFYCIGCMDGIALTKLDPACHFMHIYETRHCKAWWLHIHRYIYASSGVLLTRNKALQYHKMCKGTEMCTFQCATVCVWQWTFEWPVMSQELICAPHVSPACSQLCCQICNQFVSLVYNWPVLYFQKIASLSELYTRVLSCIWKWFQTECFYYAS